MAQIHLAATEGNIENIKKQLSNSENIDISNNQGKTPLHLAIKGGHIETVVFLIAEGANIHTGVSFLTA